MDCDSFLSFAADCSLRAKYTLAKGGAPSVLSAAATLSSLLHRAFVSLPSVTLLFGVTCSLLYVADILIDLGKTR